MIRSIKAIIVSLSQLFTVLFGIGALFAGGYVVYSGYFLPMESLELHEAAEATRHFQPESSNVVVPMRPVFTDVTAVHPHAVALNYLKDKGIVNGFEDGSFEPDAGIERGALMKLMTTAKDVYPHNIRYSHCFTDVNAEWFAPYICYGKSRGWVNGDGAFYPLDTATRAQALKIITQVFEVEIGALRENSYGDVGHDDWYAGYVAVAEERGWLAGVFEENFEADKKITRAEVGELLYRALMTEG